MSALARGFNIYVVASTSVLIGLLATLLVLWLYFRYKK